MTNRLRTAAAVLLATATATTVLALPASAVTTAAAAQVPCPRIFGVVCAQTVEGEVKIFREDQPGINPPVVRAVSQHPEPWCFFSAYGYNGDRREVSPWETVEDFGFPVFSARLGPCTW